MGSDAIYHSSARKEGRSACRALGCELACITLLRGTVHLLEDELTDAQARFQDDRQWAGIPDLELDGIAEEGWSEVRAAEPRVNGRSRNMNTQAKTRQPTLSLDSGSQARAVRQLNQLLCPSEIEPTGHDRGAFCWDRNRADELGGEFLEDVRRVGRGEGLRSPGDGKV